MIHTEALEVFYLSGSPRSSFKPAQQGLREKYDFTFIVLEPPRELLYERIRGRVDQMFEQGLEDEVRRLVSEGCRADTPGMKAIGYSEWFEEADDNALPAIETPRLRPADIVREEIKHHSCKYAKKQYTYIRDIPGSIRLDYRADEEDIKKAAEIIQSFSNDFLS